MPDRIGIFIITYIFLLLLLSPAWVIYILWLHSDKIEKECKQKMDEWDKK